MVGTGRVSGLWVGVGVGVGRTGWGEVFDCLRGLNLGY